MTKTTLHRTTRSDGLILAAILVGMFAVAFGLARRQRPSPAPTDVQQTGLEQVYQILAKVEQTTWGGSQRAQLLIAELNTLLKKNHLAFSDEIVDTGYTYRPRNGQPRVYVKVQRQSNGQYQHHDPNLLAEVIFHEALHAIQGQKGSQEQECDAYLAGLEARAAFEGLNRPGRFELEGMRIADFVLKRYPNLPPQPNYQPLGRPLHWLQIQTHR